MLSKISKKHQADVIKLVAKTLSINPKVLNINTSSDNLDRWDSLGQVKIIIELQKKYKIKIDNNKVMQLNSILSICKFINK
jgi:acyl carrier protein